ncbi:MAG: hypothetical protein GXZ02_02460 [Clostridiales bacterium]|nr:hypothetical protein [Clostridiales bacterium]
MNVILGTLIEEKKRNIRMQKSYVDEIAKLPKGSLSVKRIGKNEYCYLKYRQGKNVISEYVGKCDEKAEAIKHQIEKRRHLEKVLKNLKEEYKLITRVVKD